jgi:UDP:flavonoid glycosyltransferase YjiC (YdhE family)
MGSTGGKDTFQAAIEAFKRTDYQVMMTLGNIVQIEDLDPLPDNFHWVQLVDGYALASLADVVFCHAGNGTSYQALQAGTPLVTYPLARDQHWNARRQAELGVSKVLLNIDPTSIKTAVDEVLNDPGYKGAALRIQAEIAKYNAPQRAAQLIHDYVQEVVVA